jgi:hypothetical protein
MLSSKRITIPNAELTAEANIHFQYPIQHASWIIHPDHDPKTQGPFWLYEYTLDINLCSPSALKFHVSADQRFEFFCDDQFVGMGPDRCDLRHWSFHSYELALEAGAHQIKALVHYIKDDNMMPHAQITAEAGFICASEETFTCFNTGTADWKVRAVPGYSISGTTLPNYHVVGPNYTIDGNILYNGSSEPTTPQATPAILAAIAESRTGCIANGWRLQPSRLPEQTRTPFNGGTIRMVADQELSETFKETDGEANLCWQALVDGKTPLTIPAETRQVILWDLDNYYCAYPELTLSGGKNAKINIEWAESCYEQPADGSGNLGNNKGDRNAIEGKRWQGYGDTFINDGGEKRFYTSPWWRAGRYIRMVVETGSEALSIDNITLQETRLPLEYEGSFSCNDAEINSIIPVAVRGIQMCSHETYMDCPYYEQMMYVGDTRLQVLTAMIMSGEERLNQRTLELFDWSRQETGFVLERYPSTPLQLSTTFSMIWVLMLRDYAWWQRSPEFVKSCMKGVRGMLEEFKAHQKDAELLDNLPGWAFIDWVPSWFCGYAPDGENGCSAVNNLLFLNCLQAAAQLEDAFGEAHYAAANRAWAERIAKAVKEKFWNEKRGMFADNLDHSLWSEHSQCLAILSGNFNDNIIERSFAGLISAEDLARTTVYFSFYLLDTFKKMERGDLIYKKLDFWKEMIKLGFKTPVEAPEPSRSDCHAWGSHPLYHLHASMAGIRPADAGFTSVNIAPQPGGLSELTGSLPHPDGKIEYTMQQDGSEWKIDLALPTNLKGELFWQGETHQLTGGTQSLTLKG